MITVQEIEKQLDEFKKQQTESQPLQIQPMQDYQFEVGQAAFSSGTIITFVKSVKGNDLNQIKNSIKDLNSFCTTLNAHTEKK